MILFMGDTHGEVDFLTAAIETTNNTEAITNVVHVGDFGIYPDVMEQLRRRGVKATIPWWVIPGNHEWWPILRTFNEKPGTTEILPGISFVAHGTVLTLEGKKIAFMGGASSVDKMIRIRGGLDWFPDEVITDEQMSRLDSVDKVDILVTHTPPQEVIQTHLSRMTLREFGLPTTWRDPCADKIQTLWDRLNRPLSISGHIHTHAVGENYRVLDINEMWSMETGEVTAVSTTSE